MKKKAVFVISKPSQYLSILNLQKAIDTYYERILICLESFKDAPKFLRGLNDTKYIFDAISSFKSRFGLFLYILKMKGVDEIYIDSDFGSINFYLILVKLKKIKIYVYEEGIGNYSTSLYHSFNNDTVLMLKFKKWLFSLLGGSEVLGGSKWTTKTYLYFPNHHAESIGHFDNVVSFPNNYFGSISTHKTQLEQIFPIPEKISTLKGKNVLIYVTSYFYELEFLKNHISNYDFILVKFHPIIRKNMILNDEHIYYLHGFTPVELLIMKLFNNKNQISLLHHNSTSAIYAWPYLKESINLGIKSKYYHDLLEYVKGINK